MDKKKILITGAGSGFGRDWSIALAKRGHEVIATVETVSQIIQVKQLAKQNNCVITVEKIDITSKRDQNYALENFKNIDILINNAGIGEGGPVSEIPVDIIRHEFEVNVFSNLEFTQGFIKQMVSNKTGKVIFISSIAGFIGGRFSGAYAASKHALEAIAEAMSDELEPFGIQVATINPGPYKTGFNDQLVKNLNKWYDPKINFIDASDTSFPIEQDDPKDIIPDIIKVVESESDSFRNVFPKKYEQIIKNEQNSIWSKKQNKNIASNNQDSSKYNK